MVGVIILGLVLILLSLALDLLTFREWLANVRAGTSYSTIPLVSLVFSIPGGVILLIAWRAFTGPNILLMVGAPVFANLMLQMGVPMILSVWTSRNRR